MLKYRGEFDFGSYSVDRTLSKLFINYFSLENFVRDTKKKVDNSCLCFI
jgi:hypothetical protein